MSILRERELPDGRRVTVTAMMFGNARLNLGDEHIVWAGWCYRSHEAALTDLATWDGEGAPEGPWHREVFTGRRREHDEAGRVVREWVRA